MHRACAVVDGKTRRSEYAAEGVFVGRIVEATGKREKQLLYFSAKSLDISDT